MRQCLRLALYLNSSIVSNFVSIVQGLVSRKVNRSKSPQCAVFLDCKTSGILPLLPRPKSALGIVPNGVASSETDPLGDRAVLLLRLGELLLRAERLVALFVMSCQSMSLQSFCWVPSVRVSSRKRRRRHREHKARVLINWKAKRCEYIPAF